MPYKVWAVNEILTAADMNTYVGNQTILSFAGTAARASAIGTPVEGMLSYVGSGVVEVYAGTATGWAEISGGGGVTVGTAAPSTPDEGDLWLNSTEAKMYVYYDDGTSAQWVAAVGGTVPQQGKILQVVEAQATTAVNSSSTSYADTGLTATITPTSATSKILVSFTINGRKSSTSAASGLNLKLLRDATTLTTTTNLGYTGTAIDLYFTSGNQYLDSPATTSATTYKVQFANGAAVSLVGVQPGSANSPSSITLLEVAA